MSGSRRRCSALDPEFADDLPLLFDFLGVADPERPLAPLDPEARQRRLLAWWRGPSRRAAATRRRCWWSRTCTGSTTRARRSSRRSSRPSPAPGPPRHHLPARVRGRLDAATCRTPRSPSPRCDADATGELLSRPARRRPLARRARRADRGAHRRQPVLHRGDRPGARRDRPPRRRSRRVPARGRARGARPAADGPGRARRAHRPAARSREGARADDVGDRQGGPERRCSSEVSDLGERRAGRSGCGARATPSGHPAGTERRREYAFKHPLTQEVAYGSQLSERRARAHQPRRGGDRAHLPRQPRRARRPPRPSLRGRRRALEAAGWHARAAAWAEAPSPADGMRHWRRVRDLAGELEPSPEVDELAAKARIGILGLAWRLGMSPEETAAIHAEARVDAEDVRLDLYYAGTSCTAAASGRGWRCSGRSAARRRGRRSGACADRVNGVAYASWIAGLVARGGGRRSTTRSRWRATTRRPAPAWPSSAPSHTRTRSRPVQRVHG